MSYPASTSQVDFIGRLVAERTEFSGVTDVPAFVEVIRDERLTKEGASALIEHLLAAPKDATAAPVRGAGLPVNRYAGDCVLCGQRVAANGGTYRRGRGGSWETLHLPGECPEAVPASAEVIAHESKTESSWAMATAILQAFPQGYYAVPSVSGTNDFTFFAVKVNQGRINPSKKGQHYFAHIVGGHDEDAVHVTPAFILKCVEAAKTVGLQHAGEQYAANFKECYRCGRQLTDEASRASGIGPECAKKGW